jgi:hypothetical protein
MCVPQISLYRGSLFYSSAPDHFLNSFYIKFNRLSACGNATLRVSTRRNRRSSARSGEGSRFHVSDKH